MIKKNDIHYYLGRVLLIIGLCAMICFILYLYIFYDGMKKDNIALIISGTVMLISLPAGIILLKKSN